MEGIILLLLRGGVKTFTARDGNFSRRMRRPSKKKIRNLYRKDEIASEGSKLNVY
jgi:hypothetical protein